MKFPVFLILVLISPLANAGSKSTDEFQAGLRTAIESGEVKNIEKLYDWSDVHFILRDKEMLSWSHPFDTLSDSYILKTIEWMPIEEFDAPLKKFVTEGKEINGNHYTVNHSVLGAYVVEWEIKDSNGFHYMQVLVGKNGEGDYVGVSTKVTKATK